MTTEIATITTGLISGLVASIATAYYQGRHMSKERKHNVRITDYEYTMKQSNEILRLLFRQKLMILEMNNQLLKSQVIQKKWDENTEFYKDLTVLSERTFCFINLQMPSLKSSYIKYERAKSKFVDKYYEIIRKRKWEKGNRQFLKDSINSYDKQMTIFIEKIRKELELKQEKLIKQS